MNFCSLGCKNLANASVLLSREQPNPWEGALLSSPWHPTFSLSFVRGWREVSPSTIQLCLSPKCAGLWYFTLGLFLRDFLRQLQSRLDVMAGLPPSELRDPILHFPSRYVTHSPDAGWPVAKIRFDKCQEWLMSHTPSPALLSCSSATSAWKSNYWVIPETTWWMG